MKKAILLLSIGALVLTSCSNEDLVRPAQTGDNNGEVAIGFNTYNPNMSRATTEQLKNVTYDFGVWAYKSLNANFNKDLPVMENYLVGWTDGTLGYVPKNSDQNLYGSQWYYENLGSTQNGSTWGGTDIVGFTSTASTSAKEEQFLKFWDKGAQYTFFMACAPYGAATIDATNKNKLTFNVEAGASQVPPMYAYAAVQNSTMGWVTPEQEADKVTLTFKRLGAMIRLAFYEVIDGYSVELVNYSDTYTTANAATLPDDKGYVFAVPTKFTAPATYAAGQYTKKGDKVVTFTGDATTFTAGTDYINTELSTAGEPIACPLWFRPLNAAGVWADTPFTNVMGDKKADAIYGGTFAVPAAQTGTPNDGFTLNVSLKLTAKDTNEEIYVRGARVHVPAEFCQWNDNTLYTYIFKVTKTVGGQATDPGDPTFNPSKDYLVPIVFDAVVESIDETEIEIPMNEVPFN